jgi:hypothetical protein
MDYAIATFCYGERYYNQTNNLIKSLEEVDEKPDIFIVTDNPDSIIKADNVRINDISQYNQKYTCYESNYYDFDFSVKRFSLLSAFNGGYENVILTDTDVTPNLSLYKTETIMANFIENTVASQVTYNFTDEQKTFSSLGDRYKVYENHFNVNYDKSLLDVMPEDCIQFISIKGDLRYKFIETWDKCIKIKDEMNLPNRPAGNIDEMCFAALYNGLNVANNSDRYINLLIANHDKWY